MLANKKRAVRSLTFATATLLGIALTASKAQPPASAPQPIGSPPPVKTEKDASRPDAHPAASTDTVDRPDKTAAQFGRNDLGNPFREILGDGAVLVGCEVSVYPYASKALVIHSITPIFELRDGTRKDGNVVGHRNYWIIRVEAEKGYVVASMLGRAGDRVDGFSMVFARRKGDRLDPTDHYSSRWLGNKNNHPLIQVSDAKSRPAIGITGQADGSDPDAIDALGVVFE